MTNLTDRYSIEITAKDEPSFLSASKAIPTGSEVAITSLPGELLAPRLAAAELVRSAGCIPVPHLAARRIGSESELVQMIEAFRRIGQVDRLFVIAGDVSEPAGPFADAMSLINSGALQRSGITRIGVAGHPEGHPSIAADKIWQALAEKTAALQAMGLPYEIVTQFSFDADAVLAWLEQLRDSAILAPVKIGVPGPASVRSLLRFAAICGVNASSKAVAKYGFSLAALLGNSGPDLLVRHLEDHYRPSAHGDVSLHFYPFGGIVKTVEWVNAFRGKNSSSVDSSSTQEKKGRM